MTVEPKPARSLLFVATLAAVLSGCNMGTSGGSGGTASTPEAQQGQAPTSPPATALDCGNVYFPVEEGASWTYAGSTAGGPYTEVDTITDMGTSAFLVQIDLGDVQWVESWKCTAEGLTQLMSDGGQWAFVLQGPDGTAKMETLSQTGVTYPLSIRIGDSWSQETTFHLTSSSENGDGRLTYEFHAVGPEEVTVPAGTFQAMRVDVSADATGPIMTVYYDGTMWLVPVLGRVKQTGETRVSDPSGEGLPATIELTAYTTP